MEIKTDNKGKCILWILCALFALCVITFLGILLNGTKPESGQSVQATETATVLNRANKTSAVIVLATETIPITNTPENTYTPKPSASVKETSTQALTPTITLTPTKTLTLTKTLTQTNTLMPTKTIPPTKTPNTGGLLPGLQPSDIRLNLENRQFKCELVITPSNNDPYFEWECIRESSAYYLKVEIWSKSLTTVDLINAGVLQFGNPDNAFAVEFLGYMATLPYDGAEPTKARSWVEQTLQTIYQNGDVRKASFGGIKFQLYGIPTARSMDIGDDLPFP